MTTLTENTVLTGSLTGYTPKTLTEVQGAPPSYWATTGTRPIDPSAFKIDPSVLDGFNARILQECDLAPLWQRNLVAFSIGLTLGTLAAYAAKHLRRKQPVEILPQPVELPVVDILPAPGPKPLTIQGGRFMDTAPLTLRDKKFGVWNENDLTIRGTLGTDTIVVDQHWSTLGTFFRREHGKLRILGSDPSRVVENFRLDSVITKFGENLYRHKKTGRVFEATFDPGWSLPIRQG